MPERQPLWTRSFTILILGSAITILGHALSGFAVSLLVLDYTGSVFLYTAFLAAYYLPQVFVPLLAGPWVDRFSRVKVIYSLDFLAGFLYLGAWLLLSRGLFSYLPFLFGVMLVGSIDSIYLVAYDSLFPNLISEGNYMKGYAVSSLLFPLAMMMTPVASWIYSRWGVEPLFLANVFLFLSAAAFETRIQAPEHYREGRERQRGSMREEFRAGLRYLRGEPGLIIIIAYFFFCMFCGTGAETLWLPYFKSRPELGVMLYSYVQAFNVAGRFVGGLLHYRFPFPPEKKLDIATAVYIVISLQGAVMLFLPPWAMIVNCFFNGLFSVTSYNIRLSATGSYVPDEYRGRFNGCFQMVTQGGTVLGQLLSGLLGEFLPLRPLTLGLYALLSLAWAGIVLPGRPYIRPIYNREA